MEGEQQSPQAKEFFKRSDISTMAKQMNRLREGEAEQEKSRVAGLKTAAETKHDIDKTERAQMAEAEKIRQVMFSGQGLGAKKGNLEAGMAPAPSAVPPSGISGASMPPAAATPSVGATPPSGSAPPPSVAVPLPPSALPVKPPIPPISPISSIPPISPAAPSAVPPSGISGAFPPISPIPSAPPRTAKPSVMPQKPNRETGKSLLAGRIFLRTSMIVLLLLIFANLYLFWKWNLKDEKLIPLFLSLIKKEQPAEIKNNSNQPAAVAPSATTTPLSGAGNATNTSPIMPTIPPSLFATDNTIEISMAAGQTLPAVLSQIISATSSDGYTRLIIRMPEQSKVIGLREFFEGLGLKAPAGLHERMDNDFTLFLYAQGQIKRLGFAAKVNDSANIAKVMLPWEATMESDFENLFVLLGKNAPALSKTFRTVAYKGASLRYQTFTKQDFGICYGVFNNYWVFTSSWQGLIKTVDKLVR